MNTIGRRIAAWSLVTLAMASLVHSQHPPQDPIGEHLFPPELLMQHQKALALTDDQKNFVKAEVQKAQAKFTDVQWQLQSEMEGMSSLLEQEKADEQRVLSQLEKILNLEREIKRTQIGLIVRIKNRLTPEQQAQLREIKSRMNEKGRDSGAEGR